MLVLATTLSAPPSPLPPAASSLNGQLDILGTLPEAATASCTSPIIPALKTWEHPHTHQAPKALPAFWAEEFGEQTSPSARHRAPACRSCSLILRRLVCKWLLSGLLDQRIQLLPLVLLPPPQTLTQHLLWRAPNAARRPNPTHHLALFCPQVKSSFHVFKRLGSQNKNPILSHMKNM
jgi:hypothetical protein